MEKREIILIAAVVIFAAVRIYQKYFRKDLKTKGKSDKGNADTLSPTREDDYEPYSGK